MNKTGDDQMNARQLLTFSEGRAIDEMALRKIEHLILDVSQLYVCVENPFDNTIITFMVVSPEQAQLWKAAPNCRTTTTDLVSKFANHHRNGTWFPPASVLLFNEDGERLAGKHRCAGAVRASADMPTWVMFNVPERGKYISNQVKPWAASDHLKCKNKKVVASVIRVVRELEMGITGNWATNRITQEQLEDYELRCVEDIESVWGALETKTSIGRLSDVAGALTYARPVIRETVDRCAVVLGRGAPDIGEAVWVPIVKALAKRSERHPIHHLTLRSMTMNALQNAYRGKVVGSVKPWGDASKAWIDDLRRRAGLPVPSGEDKSFYRRPELESEVEELR